MARRFVLKVMNGRKVGRGLLSLGMIAMGVWHLADPLLFASVVPTYLPQPKLLVVVSGVAEIAGGVGLLIPRLRKAAGWGLAALLVAVFPANLDMVRNPHGFPLWLVWLRLPFQIPLIFWALWAGGIIPREPAQVRPTLPEAEGHR